jgi:hypothetical protein
MKSDSDDKNFQRLTKDVLIERDEALKQYSKFANTNDVIKFFMDTQRGINQEL